MHEITRLDRGEIEEWVRLDAQAFGHHLPTAMTDLIERDMSLERALVSRDDGEIVGSAISELSVVTLPGLERAQVAMVVGVAVSPTHRRQGRLNSLMREQLDDCHAHGEALAMLYASEGGIYERYGYGIATFGARCSLDRRVARLREHARPAGKVRFVERETASETFPAVYAEYAPTRAGELDRSEMDFMQVLGVEGEDDLKGRFFAVYEEGGRIDGYVSYDVAPIDPTDRSPRAVKLHELCPLSPGAYVALWDFLLGVDLVSEVRTRGLPLDEPIRWLLADPRQLQLGSTEDRTWMRLVDVAQGLEARRYPVPGEFTIRLDDPFCPWNAGLYRVEVAEEWGRATVERLGEGVTVGSSVLELDVSALGSIYLGGVPASQFARVGRIRGEARVIERADRMFANDRLPFTSTAF